MSESEGRHLVICGRVQGVGFRYHMTREAVRLGLVGWVRNCSDGTVEAVVAGTAETVAAMLVWARHGPLMARVEHLAVERASGTETAELLATGSFQQHANA